jgi:hypothetical protein
MDTVPEAELEEFRLDRTQFSVVHLSTSASEGLQRVLEVAELEPR